MASEPFNAAVLHESEFEFRVVIGADPPHVVEASPPTASPAAWTPVATRTPTNDEVAVTDGNALIPPLRFHRVVQP